MEKSHNLFLKTCTIDSYNYVPSHFRYQAQQFICQVQLLLSNKMNYLIWILLLFTNFCFCVDLKVTDIARRVTSRAKNAIGWSLKSGGIHYKNFGTWNYEGAMVYRGLWEIQSALADELDFDIEPFLHDHLNFYQVCKIWRLSSLIMYTVN